MSAKNNFSFNDALSKGKKQLDSEMQMLSQQERLVRELQEAKNKEFLEKDRLQAVRTLSDIFGRDKQETETWLGESTYIPSWIRNSESQGYFRWNVLLPGLPKDFYLFVTRPPYHNTSVYMGYLPTQKLEKIESLADLAAAIKLLQAEEN